MGQRLNIEIWNNGKCLANSYYHWSAYTTTALDLVDKIIKVANVPTRELIDVHTAIRLLEITGAGLIDEDREYMTASDMVEHQYKPCNGRDDGLISVTSEFIDDTRLWAEGSVFIYLDEKRISFKVYSEYETYEWERDQRKYGDYDNPDEIDARELPKLKCNIEDIKFDDFETFKNEIKNLVNAEKYDIYDSIYNRVLAWIE